MSSFVNTFSFLLSTDPVAGKKNNSAGRNISNIFSIIEKSNHNFLVEEFSRLVQHSCDTFFFLKLTDRKLTHFIKLYLV